MKTEELSNEELMTLHQCGGGSEFRILYRRHHVDLCGFVARRLGHEAEEVAHLAFAQAYATRQWFGITRPFLPYLYRIAEHWVNEFRGKPTEALREALAGKEGWDYVQQLSAGKSHAA